MFIIYNSFAIAVTQRRSEIGILRALGATRGQIRWLFLGESAVTGLIGSVGGLAFGAADRARHRRVDRRAHQRRLRRGAAGRRGRDAARALLAARAGDRHRDEHGGGADSGAQRGARRSGAGAAEGQVPGAVGGREPAARRRWRRLGAPVASCASPCGESRVGLLRRLRARHRRRRCCSVRCCRLRSRGRFGRCCKWLRPVEGALAADSLIQAPRRTSASVAALMLSLALVIAFAGMARASYDSIIDWMDTALNPDLFVIAVAEHRRPDDAVSRRRWGRSSRRCPAWRACRWCATRGSSSGRRR